ncbi:uncharacterized protein ASPGLDRAFT_1166604 [Aspergillus glaucus CBS 516.65]|uniref:Uncharacterized protein n=1 Tax=Aspergillus glaucus CBS 516.65 TaxID=1160497 RepID=A0A1L9VTW3_ASPGL|nr:hypothetical protein ASPGLDRAFT_1166604 [Aspergillus glaucus CBS 516.65]OJJ87368.1 hypothetical protein ASPGLDRAFT_1166604 [Aspergillus glaucus CBS 516.65]
MRATVVTTQMALYHLRHPGHLTVIFVLSSIIIVISSILPVTPMVWGAAAKYMRKTLASLSKRRDEKPPVPALKLTIAWMSSGTILLKPA